ncbi:SURF1 family protein [Demequina rhizosphaerae]|uniref:SURF1 family protein n=1 Tax=Demequina rhizosphaerae TaxID=1638985 RepID=UPI0007818F23|nr:SURF1 family protein [Demequina rhizosphaerae]
MTTPSLASRILRVVGIVALALAVCAVAVRAGFWQLGRHEARSAAIAAYEANAAAAPASLDEAVGADGSVSPEEEWRLVEVTGVIDADSQTLLRNRPVDRTAAYQLLVWLDTDDGRSLLLNAGWMQVPGPDADPEWPEYPTGEVTVTAVLRQSEPDDGRRDSGATRITAAQMPEPNGAPIDGYGMIREACDSSGCVDSYALQVPLPTLSLGPHLAYTWQWFAFALIAPVAGVLLARREWQAMSGDDAPAGTPREPREPRRRRRAEPTDEEIEDAL